MKMTKHKEKNAQRTIDQPLFPHKGQVLYSTCELFCIDTDARTYIREPGAVVRVGGWGENQTAIKRKH